MPPSSAIYAVTEFLRRTIPLEVSGLVYASLRLDGFCECGAESRTSQVVRLSLEDAISPKAVGSPDCPGSL